MAVVLPLSRRNPQVGGAAASPFTHQCREALALAEALVQHLSPAKDEGWKNYGTEQAGSDPVCTSPNRLSPSWGIPALGGAAGREPGQGNSSRERVEVGNCSG